MEYMLEVGVLSALIGGILTFLAPCTLPLIPAYIGFISGTTGSADANRRSLRIFISALYFVLGFSLVFVVFGMASGELGKWLTFYRTPISQAGGIFIILLGISALGFFQFPVLMRGGARMPKFLLPGTSVGAFLLGFLFALGWSPCLGPILGTILLLAGTSGSALSGGLLLSVYALGLALPFLFIAYLYGTSLTYIQSMEKWLPVIGKISGVLLIVIGTALALGQFGALNPWVRSFLDYDALVNYM